MPLGGVGATKQIRALPAPKCNIPLIALTEMSGTAINTSLQAWMTNVSKPIEPAILLGKLTELAHMLSALD